ncbi:hypothetical protein PN462_22950 [Spirulina sp. CS-785/01]|uniref:hypothetical protein n=1 Tax=Spirulina sp. CS-785/01 TaxID=3021716 RepID=UPI00232E94A3|nr:hypothetical protein [Spirulina sp. CS-785/01]MDB9315988.1 hypothetical protein [Spirulina sp. CS-785/01]
MIRGWRHSLLVVLLLLTVVLSACSAATPPVSYAPGGELVKKAIALQLEQSQQQLSEQLQGSHPALNITNIAVKTIDPLYFAQLPTYHLKGTYKLEIELPNQNVTQEKNEFDIYLQRQKEGKTWRWLKREVTDTEKPPIWRTYLVR